MNTEREPDEALRDFVRELARQRARLDYARERKLESERKSMEKNGKGKPSTADIQAND